MKYQKINVMILLCFCKNCGIKYNVYKMSDFSYGERFFLTEDGSECAYLNCLTDPNFHEVSSMVDKLLENKKLSELQIAECFNKVFGSTCDLLYGKKIDSSRSVRSCKNCGSTSLGSQEYVPSIVENVSVPVVTHEYWESLSTIQKEELITKLLLNAKCL